MANEIFAKSLLARNKLVVVWTKDEVILNFNVCVCFC